MASAPGPLVMGMKRKVVKVTVRHALPGLIPLTWSALTVPSGLAMSSAPGEI